LRLSLSFILGAVNIGRQANSPLFEIARVLVRLDHTLPDSSYKRITASCDPL
jgi:hypothetical protein